MSRDDHSMDHLVHMSHLFLTKPPNFKQLSRSLIRLDISFNNIESIDSFSGLPITLRELWLNDNPLQRIDSSIGNLQALGILDLSRTLVKKLPAEIGQLSLKLFNVQGCQFLKENHKEFNFFKGKLFRQQSRNKIIKDLQEGMYASQNPIKVEFSIRKICKELKDMISLDDFKRIAMFSYRLFSDKLEANNSEIILKNLLDLTRKVMVPESSVPECRRKPLLSNAYWLNRLDTSENQKPVLSEDFIVFDKEIELTHFQPFWMTFDQSLN